MDLKKKFKTFINQQNLRSPLSPSEENSSHPLYEQPPAIKEKLITEAELITQDPQVEAEILASIESIYCSDEDFDSGLYELKKIEEGQHDNGYIKAQKHLLWRQLQVVSKKVSDLILQNQPGYTLELQRVTELQTNLQQALVICGSSRTRLKEARDQFTVASLGILAKYRKRQHLLGLLQSLHTIKTLQQTDVRLRELMEEENYPGAIQLCLACQKAASNFRHYKCISELSSKLQDTLVMIEEQLDVALSAVCGHFNTDCYQKLHTAYRLLGKTQTAMDQLHMHFTSAIHNRAFTIILKYVEMSSPTNGTNLQKRQYNDLCSFISSEHFTSCLLELCKALWEIMLSYHCIMQWHNEDDNSNQANGAESNVEMSLNRQYIKQKLEHGLLRVWQDIQHKVKIFLQAVDLSLFKFDEFIRVLNFINRLMQIGKEFCGSKSEALQESVRKQSINYFRNYHRTRIDELKTFLENEGWEPCPVKSNFSILKLAEFKFMTEDSFHNLSIANCVNEQNDVKEKYFEKYLKEGNPFDAQHFGTEEDEDVYEDSKSNLNVDESGTDSDDSDVDDELKRDYVDENTGEIPTRRHSSSKSASRKHLFHPLKGMPPILSNTALNLLRLVGKYVQMMSLLLPIAFDVILCMSQLYDYYLYSIYNFFVNESENMSTMVNPTILRVTIKRIKDNLILHQSDVADDLQRDKIMAASLSPLVNNNSSKMYGLAERVVAVESLIYLSEQLIFLQKYLETALPQNKKLFIQQFYSQTIASTVEMRKPVYLAIPWQSINFNQVLALMAEVQWDIGDIMSMHSSYVDYLLQELGKFNEKLHEIAKESPIPKESYDILWSHCIRIANCTFVEGFSCAKKCSHEGRALMQLDFQHFLMKLDKITELRPIPWKEHVEAYVKAFYLPETALDGWIKEHQEYSSKQLISLVSCMSMTRRGRQRLINAIEENEKLKK